MWLLDANMDVHLVEVLESFHIACDTAIARGWGAIENGELVAAAVRHGFDCLLTKDRLFGESAAQSLHALGKAGRRLGRLARQDVSADSACRLNRDE